MPERSPARLFLVLMTALLTAPAGVADLKMTSVFGDHMVLQRQQPVHIWGWTTPGTKVQVEFRSQKVSGTADDNGRFDVMLDAEEAGGPDQLTVSADESRTFKDVLVGEVWLCSGQSNMAWQVSNSNDADLERLTAKYPQIRLISVPQVASQEPLNDFNGQWAECTPDTVNDFSAVGYFFGRQLHQTLDVPIGLIDNAWGGSACEAWIPRELLEGESRYDALMADWERFEQKYEGDEGAKVFQAELDAWKSKADQAVAAGKQPPPKPQDPQRRLRGNHRPGNLYGGVLRPILGYTIRGAIWYQGESNAGRAYQYRDLFPLMISTWRTEWNQGDFPFYWVSLADFQREVSEPGDSSWAELREAQTMTMDKLPNAGEAIITDLGESDDIHPRNKQDVANRLARWALARQYGLDIVHQSPRFREMETADSRITVHFDHVGGGLDTFDVREPIGFAIAGADRRFVNATARIVDRDTIEVWSDSVADPVAVRYAWAQNPVCNVQNKEGLPMTPFRTDDWPGVTADRVK